jgi:D-glycero-D-manno-heptose 1,7-bisphosphate phosphatase
LSARCVFLDRDGVINQKPAPGEYIRSLDDFRVLPNAVDWIRLFNALGFLVIVVTNQRGVALGLMTESDLARIHQTMLAELAAKGARIDDIFYCPHAENSCDCRKPKPGLVYAARDKWDIDLGHSLLLGDSDNDQQLAAACGVPFLKVVDSHIA